MAGLDTLAVKGSFRLLCGLFFYFFLSSFLNSYSNSLLTTNNNDTHTGGAKESKMRVEWEVR